MNGSREKRPPDMTSAGSSTEDTTETSPREEVPGLPRLNYNLLDHKWKLSIVTFLLVLESSILPIALFYGLWFGTTLRHGIRTWRTQLPPHRTPLFFFVLSPAANWPKPHRARAKGSHVLY